MSIKTIKVEGYTFKIKSSLSFKEYRSIMRSVLADSRVAPGSDPQFSGEALLKAQDIYARMLLISMTTPEGNEIKNSEEIIKTLEDLPAKIGMTVYSELDRIFSESATGGITDKKKGS